MKVCGKKDIHVPECSDCAELEERVADVEECCANNTEALEGKQDELISGTNIKTINGESLLGDGDITVSGGGEVMFVNYIFGDDLDYIDKSFAELKNAFLNGATVICIRDSSWNDPDYGNESFSFGRMLNIDEQVETGTQTSHQENYAVWFEGIGNFVSTSLNENMYIIDN